METDAPTLRAWTPPTLETERLILRALREDDAPAIFEYASNPNVARHTRWEANQNIDQTRSFLWDYAFANYARAVPEPFGIALREEPALIIGTVGCSWKSDTRFAELGYALSEKHWGRGYVPEAARAVIEFIFGTYPVVRIFARCKAENHASARVMEKIGMTKEGTLRSSYFHRGVLCDIRFYSILRSEWEAARAKLTASFSPGGRG